VWKERHNVGKVRNVERKYDNLATGRGRDPVSVCTQERKKGYGRKTEKEKERKRERKKERM
jgi:c-di-AMP phosphodiesterase-like protein